ncbi:hypothetical protein NQ314_021456 [Rhamnusium bicolor]|uniref:Glucose-methanol-choline oxidoreductase C-terminal domain-containing protein n=1 Tax=Rhamnusium bicolor TaxID=1586634 RepID=A0AAV8WHD4_9CUCU|nr:hypothetical protein NQ314_021456 [Rhamnusium bicolor]
MTTVLLHTHSVGSIKLKSSSPFDYPLIDYNFLSDPNNKDINALYEGIQFCMRLVNTTAFQQVGAKFESRPLPACKDLEYLSKDYWFCLIRQTTLAVYHPVGTCPIGTDPATGAVVDSELKVFGIKKLRVADSSVFPFTLTGHPSAACAMVGEKISDTIKLNYSETP